MRYHEMMTEAAMRPSQALIDAVKAWVGGWSFANRPAAEAALWAVRDEAMRFLAPRYGMLYRGMAISKVQEDALNRDEAIMVDLPRLASWSKVRQIAEDYADNGEALVVIGKRNLKPILDIKRFMRFFPDDRAEDDPSFPADYRRDAAREAEVVCEHDGPLKLERHEVKIL